MSHYRRCYLPGGSFFLTTVTERRRPILCTDLARACLRAAILDCQRQHPFRLDAIVLMPDHFHAIFTLPPDDTHYPKRMGLIKKRFTQCWLAAGGAEQSRSASRQRYRRRGVWQRRFMEHTLRDQRDYTNHLNYPHFNPVKHGHAACPRDWPYSSFHRWVNCGAYTPDWGCGAVPDIDIDDLSRALGE
ncbi:REP-associated tyrosine transposase [Thiobaca trueperi]|uniref:Putative transposase n=1 Tax=Thiobaca trueperi TaxID=127458 RepID=A0A4R3N3U0_9GAMM|nr:transposase [Thiobaca trueperi]TCT22881.1 putative transposase [Thiobaca trueperi]